MKKIGLLGIVMVVVLLAGCQDAQKAQLAACQEEKLAVQGQLDQANAAIAQKDQKIEAQKAENREVQQKALESIRTMMEKQNAVDVERKNKLAAKEAEAAELGQKVTTLEEQLKAAQSAVEAAQAAERAAQEAAAKAAQAAAAAKPAPVAPAAPAPKAK